MKQIKPIKTKIKPSQGNGIFHDSRGDINALSQVINEIINKQNEVIETVNKLIDLQEKGQQ